VPRADGTSFTCSHWFDGFGQTYRFEIIPQPDSTTKVLYNSRRSNDKIRENAARTGKYGWITFAQRRDPCIGIFGKLMSIWNPAPTDPANINISVTLRPDYPGLESKRECGKSEDDVKSLWAASDVAVMKELDPETLEPIGVARQTTLHPALTGPLSCAHAMKDPDTGDLLNYNLDFGRYAIYRVFKTSSSGETDILATITGPGVEPAYVHSFFMTADYIILGIWGARLAWYGAKVIWEQNMLDAFSPFDENVPVKWFVVDRKHGRGLVAEFESPALFCFHTVNAWQEENAKGGVDVICDLMGYVNLDIMHMMYYSNLVPTEDSAASMQSKDASRWAPQVHRYRLRDVGPTSLARGESKIQQAELILKTPKQTTGDLPTLNPRFKMAENRYLWSIVGRGLSTFFDGISKYDFKTGEVLFWKNPQGHTPGEAIFIPNPDGFAEDEGILLSVILDGFKETSYLVCLDARNMEEIGRAECDWVVGIGTHGAHVKGTTVLT
jgi:torulene dioxygenase